MRQRIELSHLVYELTEACNQNCKFCYNHWRPDGSQPIDTRLARRTLARLLRQAKVGSLSFSGGEPTLLNNVHNLVLRARFWGAKVNILTNGTKLTEDDIENYTQIGLSTYQIPLLSCKPEIHDYLTGVEGAWKKANHSVCKILEKVGSEHLAVVLILTACNREYLKETLDWYYEMGVRTVMVNRFNLGGNGLQHKEELCLSQVELRKAFRVVSDFAISHSDMRFVSGVCTPLCVMDPREFPGVRFTTCTTEIQNRPITINYRGDVRFCNHSPFVLGNIWNRNLRDILEDEQLIARYSGVPTECVDCKLYARCKGGCRAASEQVYGTFERMDPISEIL